MRHVIMTVIVLCSMVAIATAQSTPPAIENSRQSPSQPATTAPQPPQQGWMWWDDSRGRDMNIAVDRMKELRGVDDRYRQQYNALGETPWTSPVYQELTDRRNAEIKGLLTPEQYQQWSRTTTSNPPASTPIVPADPAAPAPKR
jgi:hypothetical protein